MRMIDADWLSEAIRDNVPAPYEDASWAKENCLAEIDAAPTVDAVEVVRCRDCIGRSTWYNDAEYGCAVCGMSGMYPKSENGYCSYGLMRNNEE